MRKRIIHPAQQSEPDAGRSWLALGEVASVEVSSEAEAYPVEGALLRSSTRGWRAGSPGTQIIRLLFDQPQNIRVIRLVFTEDESPRTQEFVLRWLAEGDATAWKDIVRQQWNFSPPDTTQEHEEYQVELAAATALELNINPDISRGQARASLEKLQVAVE